MRYLTYDEYINMDGICDETAFNRHIVRACGIIDDATHNRVENMDSVPIQVNELCRDLIEYLETNTDVSEKSVASYSESAGPIIQSVSYSTINRDEMREDIQDMLYDYLGSVTNENGTPLLYRGCIG